MGTKLASAAGGGASSTTVSATRAGSSSLSATSIPVTAKLTMEFWAKDLLSSVEAPPGSSENEHNAYVASPTPKTRSQGISTVRTSAPDQPRHRVTRRVTTEGPRTP